jgi:hypothetical protein
MRIFIGCKGGSHAKAIILIIRTVGFDELLSTIDELFLVAGPSLTLVL